MKEQLNLDKCELKNLENIAKEIRCSILNMVTDAEVGHIGGSLSITDILTALYFKILRIDPKNPSWEDRDRLILSKGHAATALYSTLAYKGFFDKNELKNFGLINSTFQVHPDRKRVPGVEASTGALGQGLSIAIGIALAAKLDKKNYHTYAILGDGENQEGQIWEAAMFASHYKLDNISAIIDYNNVQLMGNVPDIMNIAPLDKKWSSFGWEVISMDGHDYTQIIKSLYKAKEIKTKPTVIIAKTIKGKGVTFMENTCTWHGSIPTKQQCKDAICEIKSNTKV